MSSFTIGGKRLADPEIKQIFGREGLGFHRLDVRIDFHLAEYPGEEKPMILNLGGELKIKAQGNNYIIGKMTPNRGDRVLKTLEYSKKTSCYFEIDLDARRIEAIERLRSGGGLYFIASIWGTAFSKENGVHEVSADLHHDVNQGTWVEILRQLGFANYMLIEIPVPDKKSFPELAEATEHLTSAQKAMMNGEYREAVGCCRDVLESISTILGDNDIQDPEVQQLFVNTKLMDKSARQRLLRRALKIITHPARHADEVSKNIEWQRLDSIAMITMTSTMLRWINYRGTKEV